MRNTATTLLLSSALATLALSASLAAVADANTASASAKFGWLTGCWQYSRQPTKEIWSKSYDGVLFGYSVTMRGEQLLAFEDMRIEPTATGSDFIASPNGKDPVRFHLAKHTESSLTFANPEHDFPQLITYARDGDRLRAEISRTDGENAITLTMTACSQ